METTHRRRALTVTVAMTASMLSAACAHRSTDLVQPVGETHTTASSTGGARPQGIDQPSAPLSVTVDEAVRRGCSLPLDRQTTAPRFDMDSARLRPRGEDVLARIAACIVSGRLGDAPLTVIGHTDPRGSESYNRQLGEYRAIAAKQYLVDLGVPASRITVESRGEREARGTDEASWALDRRVEVRASRGPGDISQ